MRHNSKPRVVRCEAVVAVVCALALAIVGAGCSDAQKGRPTGDLSDEQATDLMVAPASTLVAVVPTPSISKGRAVLAESISVSDLPVTSQQGDNPPRSSLATSVGLDTGEIERFVPISTGLAMVGSIERAQQGSVPAIVMYGPTERGVEELSTQLLEFPDVGSASAVDLVELADGSLRVFGWEDHPDGPTALLWRLSPDATPVLERRFEAQELAGNAQLIELDATGRTWLVSTRPGFDGTLDVALETADGWVSRSVDAGFVGNIQAAAFGDRLTVWSSGQLLDADGALMDAGWIARTYILDGQELQTSEAVFAAPGVVIGDAAWVNGEYILPMTETTGASTLWSTTDGVSWSQLDVATPPGMLVRAIIDAPFGTVVLIGADHADPDTGLWAMQAFVAHEGGIEPWSMPFTVDTLAAPWSNDLLVDAIGSQLVVLDRPPRAFPTMLIVDPAGASNLSLSFPMNTPDQIERVVDIMASPEGLVAVVGKWSAAEHNMWNVELSSIYLLRAGQWLGITNAYVQATAMWEDRPLFAIPSETGTLSWYSLVGRDVQMIGSTSLFTTVNKLITVGDELWVVGAVDDRQRLFHGQPEDVFTEAPGLPDDHTIVELCANDAQPYVVIESMLDGSRQLASIEDGSLVVIDQLSPWLADPTLRRRPPLCWVTNDTVGVMGEFDLLADTTTPVIAWQPIDGVRRLQSTQRSFHTLPGSVGYDTAPGEFITNIVGVAHDRHGSFDAVWWSTPESGQLINKGVFGGNGRQEATSVLHVSDGFLIGGTDNGEPIIWIVPDT